jgi:leader peptidase (prepilin peptidase)/N-methyltransferase
MFLSLFLLPFILFALGAAVGSFVNVVIFRSIEGESWVWGRSHCDVCQKPIRWFDNIPLVSFVLLRGKCRACRNPISISNPVVEFLTGTLFLWWYVGGEFFFHLTSQPFHYIQPLFWLVVGVLILIIFVTDAMYFIIPDEAVALLGMLTFLYRLTLTLSGVMQPTDFLRTILGTLLCTGFFFSLWFFTKGRGLGLGDVKFSVPFALLLGWPNVFVGMFLSFVIGGMVGLLLLVTKKKNIKEAVPFGPFLVAGLLVTLVCGGQILSWYMHLVLG